jgi:arginyl-tRNA synthetase
MAALKAETKHTAALIRDGIAQALSDALVALGITDVSPESITIERPRDADHGDFSSKVAFAAAKVSGRAAETLANELVAYLADHLPPHVASVNVAGKGFINFKLGSDWLQYVLKEVIAGGFDGYARHNVGAGKRVIVEFISANPTGPLHVGNGWLACYGDTVARLHERCGYKVHREYYVNDTGGQIRALGKSLLARKRGEDVGEDGYQGAYVAELAAEYTGSDDVMEAGTWAALRNLDGIKSTIERLGIKFDAFQSQREIEDKDQVQKIVDTLRKAGFVYEQDGATLFKGTACGDKRDRFLTKKGTDGEFTYFAGDVAYHYDKLVTRGFDHAITILGSDHAGQVPSLKAALKALGVETSRLEVPLGQMISLVDEGIMSKRKGNFVSMDSLLAEIGADAMRFLSLTATIDRPRNLNLKVARAQTMENPVHYVNYGHARICSIGRTRSQQGVELAPVEQCDFALLTGPTELAMLKSLAELPDVVLKSCVNRAPHMVTVWLQEMAGELHSFYKHCRVLGEGVSPELTQARLWLLEAARIGLKVGLDLLGIVPPEHMERPKDSDQSGDKEPAQV